MTSTATTKTSNPSVTIYGNVGNDPETITFEARTEVVTVYDPTIDELVEKPISIPAGSAIRFSVAVNYKDGNGGQQTRWINVFDPELLASKNLVRKGTASRSPATSAPARAPTSRLAKPTLTASRRAASSTREDVAATGSSDDSDRALKPRT